MKVDSSGVRPTFVPRSITITFETQDELDLFGSLFNNCKVARVLREKEFNDPKDIYKKVNGLGGNSSKYANEFD